MAGIPGAARRFRVDGLPAPKGSKSGFVVSAAKYKDGRGTWHLNPRVVLVEGRRRGEGVGTSAFDVWTDRVKAATLIAQAVHKWNYLEDQPLQLEAWFFLPRPASLPKREAFPHKKPDLEKLVRAIMDEMEGVIYDNDSRFIDHYTHKRYATDDHPIGVEITIGTFG